MATLDLVIRVLWQLGSIKLRDPAADETLRGRIKSEPSGGIYSTGEMMMKRRCVGAKQKKHIAQLTNHSERVSRHRRAMTQGHHGLQFIVNDRSQSGIACELVYRLPLRFTARPIAMVCSFDTCHSMNPALKRGDQRKDAGNAGNANEGVDHEPVEKA